MNLELGSIIIGNDEAGVFVWKMGDRKVKVYDRTLTNVTYTLRWNPPSTVPAAINFLKELRADS